MRIAILSDIHGNLPALEAVVAHVHTQHVDAIYCLGDLVGYGASPNEVVDLIRDASIPTVIGNYDDGVGFDRDDCGCAYRHDDERDRGQRSLMWTRAVTTADRKEFLRSLVPEIRFEADGKRVLLVHGSPRKLNEYLFEDRPLSSFERLAAGANADLILFGHTHRPYAKLVGATWFINAGSIGKPKDGDWRAGYVILSPAAEAPATFIRVPYDVASAAAAIRATELPHEFAADIESGGAAAK
jgi:putative phosphoesterase